MTFENTKIQNLQKRINDLEAKKQVLKTKQTLESKKQRKAKTRTLIQAGALLKMLGFFDLCNIGESDDLQNVENEKNAAFLIGILESLKSERPAFLSDTEKEHFKNIGIRVLKMNKKR